MRAGPNLVGLRAPVRTLHGGRYPLMRYGQRLGGVRYDVEAFASIVAGQPVALVRVVLRNQTARPLQARWAVGLRSSGGALKPSGVRRFRFPRPAVPQLPGLYTQPGWQFDAASRYAFGDRAILRDGNVMATFAPPAPGVQLEFQQREGTGPVVPATTFDLVEYRVALGPRGTRHLDFVVPSKPVPDAYARRARAARRAVRRASRRDAPRLAGDVRPCDAAQPPRAPRAGRVLREPHAHAAAALPAARRRLGAAGQQAALPRVLAARRVDHDPGARPRRPASRGGREPRLLRPLAARRRPVHLARRPARRPRPGDVGDRRARAAQPRPRVRARRAAFARPRGRVAAPCAGQRRARARAGVGPARQRARRGPSRGRRLLGGRRAAGGGRRRSDARRERAGGGVGRGARRPAAHGPLAGRGRGGAQRRRDPAGA